MCTAVFLKNKPDVVIFEVTKFSHPPFNDSVFALSIYVIFTQGIKLATVRHVIVVNMINADKFDMARGAALFEHIVDSIDVLHDIPSGFQVFSAKQVPQLLTPLRLEHLHPSYPSQ